MGSWSGRGSVASSMKIRSKPIELAWLYVPFMLLLPNIGCISIQNASPAGLPRVANCNDIHSGLTEPGGNSPLYERHEVLDPLASKLYDAKLIGWASNCKQRSSQWVSDQWSRCETAKTSIQCWIHTKRKEANAPPWPRFHPVPTRPVFEPEEKGSSTTPEIYGRFGKG